jgi:hypothetical protein
MIFFFKRGNLDSSRFVSQYIQLDALLHNDVLESCSVERNASKDCFRFGDKNLLLTCGRHIN